MKKKANWWVVRSVSLGVGLVVLAAATVVAWRWVLYQRTQLELRTQEVASLPETQARQTALSAEIQKRSLDVQRIRAFIVSKEQLAAVVSEVEDVGRAAGVTVSIPTVEEKQLFDDNGNTVAASGPLLDVRLKIVATGSPKKLLVFLHSIEHMQRLTYFESWRLDASEQTARNQASTLQGTEEKPAPQVALLTADMIVAVEHTEGGSAL